MVSEKNSLKLRWLSSVLIPSEQGMVSESLIGNQFGSLTVLIPSEQGMVSELCYW
ncbi:hypothetical protein CRENPOLYSF2_1390011 [Crenothrix polyspora]|uniref:Uncharacterized protein n=1 Tax=Crenothrix polyspora TaxID=360316 RepID=A0A1R4H0X7_9GAMM|nr:hypothetical protein CRENPOLYSF2_1390011 [Crenothrix polyspora]